MLSLTVTDSGDTNTKDEESDVGILPVPSALTNETLNTTEAVSAQQSTTRSRLNHGSNDELPTESLDSDSELADDEGDMDDFPDPESEEGNDNQHSGDEEESEKNVQDISRWDLSIPASHISQLPSLLPLPMHESRYLEDEPAYDETNAETRSFNIESSEDVQEGIKEDEETKEETDALAPRSSSVQPGVPPSTPPPRLREVRLYLNIDYGQRLRELFGEGHGEVPEVCGEADVVKGKKRGSEYDDKGDERDRKVQRRF